MDVNNEKKIRSAFLCSKNLNLVIVSVAIRPMLACLE